MPVKADPASAHQLAYRSPDAQRAIHRPLLIVALGLPTIVAVAFVVFAEWPTRNAFLVESATIWGILAAAIGGSAVLLHRSGVHPAFLLLFVPAQVFWVFFFSLWLVGKFGDPVVF